jgi:hypothetical protein
LRPGAGVQILTHRVGGSEVSRAADRDHLPGEYSGARL